MSFVKNFDSFFPVIILKQVCLNLLFYLEQRLVLDKSLRVLQLSTHRSNLTAND